MSLFHRFMLVSRYHFDKRINSIMSAISDYAAKQKEYNDRISTGLGNIAGDIAEIKRKLEEMQNNPGPISAEDQALLDGLLADAERMASRVTEIDDMTPPAVPTA